MSVLEIAKRILLRGFQKIWTNQKAKVKFAIISTDTDETAQKIITVLQNNPMDGRYPLRAHFHIRN